MATSIQSVKVSNEVQRREAAAHQATMLTSSVVNAQQVQQVEQVEKRELLEQQRRLPVPTQNELLLQSTMEAAEKEKIWCYMDTRNTVQGPFAIKQLRKRNTDSAGYFAKHLRIWKRNESRNESVSLKDVLGGRVQRRVGLIERCSNTSSPAREKPWNPWNSVRLGSDVMTSIQDEISQILTTGSSMAYNGFELKMDNEAARDASNGWATRERSTSSSGEAGESSTASCFSLLHGDQGSRSYGREILCVSSGLLFSSDTGSEAGKTYPIIQIARSDAAARFDPTNWASSRTGVQVPDLRGMSLGMPSHGGDWVNGVGDSGGVEFQHQVPHLRGMSLGMPSPRGDWLSGVDDSGGAEFQDQYMNVDRAWNGNASLSFKTSRSRRLTRAARKNRASRKNILCRFFQKGYCKRGDKCHFKHGKYNAKTNQDVNDRA